MYLRDVGFSNVWHVNAYSDLQTLGLIAGSLAVRHLYLLILGSRSSNTFSTYMMGEELGDLGSV